MNSITETYTKYVANLKKVKKKNKTKTQKQPENSTTIEIYGMEIILSFLKSALTVAEFKQES